MNILLINLPRYKSIPVVREERCEMVTKARVDTPATLLIMASILRGAGHKIEFIDANGFDLSYEDISGQIINEKFDCVIFPFCSKNLNADLKICSIVKTNNQSCITIAYSWYARHYAKELLNEFFNLDIQIIGPSLSIIGNLIECICENGNLDDVSGIAYRDKGNQIKMNSRTVIELSLNDLPIPAYDLLPSFKPYYLIDPFMSPYSLVYAGKGCPFKCKYCTASKTNYSCRSADNIIKELKMLKKMGGVKYVWFFDEVFTINRKRVIEICERILEENIKIKWFCDTRVELVDEELLKIMRKGGCIGISYGVESGSQKVLDEANKGIKVEQAYEAVRYAKDAGIKTVGHFILGLPGETEETMKHTIEYSKQLGLDLAQFYCAVPFPGSRLYDRALNEGCIKNSGFDHFKQDSAFMELPTVSSRVVNNYRNLAYRKFYFNLSRGFRTLKLINWKDVRKLLKSARDFWGWLRK